MRYRDFSLSITNELRNVEVSRYEEMWVKRKKEKASEAAEVHSF